MQVLVNDHHHEMDADSSLLQLLEKLELSGGRIAVELNGEIVPRSSFHQCQLHNGDNIEIVQAIGGG